MKNLDRRIWIVFLIQVTEVLGFSLILPFLPFYAQEYGASPLTVGLLLTVFSLFQFLSAPVMGRLSDLYGRRPLLLLSQLSTFISFIVLGFSNSLFLIFLSRIIDGALGSNFTIAQAYISDVTSKKDRSKAFGISGAAFGIGFMVGPAIGGFLSQFGYSLPAFVAAGIVALSILLTHRYLPETVVKTKKPFALSEIQIFQFGHFRKYFLESKVAIKMWRYFFYVLSHATWVSGFALFMKIVMGIEADIVGYLYAYIGLVSTLFRVKIIPWLVDRYPEPLLEKLATGGIILSLLGGVISNSLWAFVGLVTIFALSTGTARPLLTGSISRSASEKEQGAVMGVTNSLGSIAQIIGPLVGGVLLDVTFPQTLLLAAAMFMFWGFILMFKK